MRWRRGVLIGATAAGVSVAALLGARFHHPLALSLALASSTMDAWLGPLYDTPIHEPITLDAGHRSLAADLYRPASPRGALLLVHGLSRWGRRHPELVRLAQRLARHGQLVLVPEFEGLAAFRLGGREVEEVRAALRHLGTLSPRSTGAVGVAGFSFGAGPAVLAAEGAPGLRVAGSFGGYADLRHVVLYITTGVHAFGGRVYAHRQEEYNRWKLLALLVAFVEHAEDRQILHTLVERKLGDPADRTETLEAQLGDEGRSVLALVLNRRPDAVPALLARLPARARETLDRLSPLRAVPRLSGRLLIAHGAGDDSIPFTESLRLAEAAGGRARVAILESFHHTGPQPLWESVVGRVTDAWALFRVVDGLLATP